MRRDICFYIEADVKSVYQAYLNAATHSPFDRSCQQQPYHMISFGVNNSFKYNMNGGACTLHFMPQGTGTAVNMRFSIAQLMGARYERYAEDLNKAMQAFLPVAIRQASYNVDDFLKPQNQLTPSSFQPAPAPKSAPAPAPVYVSQPAPTFVAQTVPPAPAPAPAPQPTPTFVPQTAPPAQTPTFNPTEEINNIELIRRYKGLLSDGIITEEEFAAKKKQLLGL
jgi:hypothetical protein